jgi:hypothetical protein
MRCHTFVTTMLDAGVDLRDVQIAARHANPRTTGAGSPEPGPPSDYILGPSATSSASCSLAKVTTRVWLSRVPSMWAGQTA